MVGHSEQRKIEIEDLKIFNIHKLKGRGEKRAKEYSYKHQPIKRDG